jgi:hypothetical protein
LLSFTFGSDRMAHWEKISRTAGYQSALYRLPDGRFQRRRKPKSPHAHSVFNSKG